MVICSFNALPQLRQNLPHWLSQEYPDYELILVDDGSTDGTKEYLESISIGQPHLKYIHIPKHGPGKKQALLTSVSIAKNAWLALTDADCRPAGKFWLKNLMGVVTPLTDLVIGYAPYERENTFLNAFIRYECCLNAIQMMSASAQGIPYAAVGRNLVYRKNLLTKEALQTELPYGDDDLLVQYYSKNMNSSICLDPGGFCYTKSESSYYEYFQRKRRHYATARTYSVVSKLFLGIFFTSLMGFYAGLFFLVFLGYFYHAAILLFLKYALSWPLFCKLSKLLNEQDLCKAYPVWEMSYVCHLILQIPFLLVKRKHW